MEKEFDEANFEKEYKKLEDEYSQYQFEDDEEGKQLVPFKKAEIMTSVSDGKIASQKNQEEPADYDEIFAKNKKRE